MIEKRPSVGDFDKYYQKYVDLVEDDNVLGQMKYGLSRNIQFFNDIKVDQWNHRYEPGKWSVKEVLQHVVDTERIMSYRALRVARNDMTPMPGFEQDDYIKTVDLEATDPTDIINEYFAVRKASLAMFSSFEGSVWDRKGTASDNPITVLALAYIIAGHEIHHLDVLKKKYL